MTAAAHENVSDVGRMGRPPMRVVVFSEVKWRYMRTRKRFLLSRFPPDWPILFLEPFNRTDANPILPVTEGRVTVAALPVLKPRTTFPLVNALLNQGVVRELITALVSVWVRILLLRSGWFRAGDRSPRLIYLSNVLAIPVAEKLPRDLLLYDANDDPVGFPGNPSWVAAYLDRTLRAADLVVSCSESLAARLAARRLDGKIAVVGNGVEIERFAGRIDPVRVPEQVRGRARPWIGYAGAVSEWFDFELIGDVAAAYSKASVVIVGPVASTVAGEARALAGAHPNVCFVGRVPYEDLPHVMGSLDVALIPFRLGPATDVLNPNKLYEYLAAGRTVVSLDYSCDVERLGEWILIARDRREFVARVGEALAQPRDSDQLRAVARHHTWDSRAAELLDLVSTQVGVRA